MGFSPMEGLIMGTRCGDIDAGISAYIAAQDKLNSVQINQQLNSHSGLFAIAGTEDMRVIQQLIAQGNKEAVLALEMFCYRIKKYIGAYYAALGNIDALVFTGGIGEHDAPCRALCVSNLEALGLVIDTVKNQQVQSPAAFIHRAAQKIAILVIKTDEELEIANQVYLFTKQLNDSR